jgi:hypothetical protein
MGGNGVRLDAIMQLIESQNRRLEQEGSRFRIQMGRDREE